MKETRWIMGMPITVDIVNTAASEKNLADIFDYFTHVDEVFSTYKQDSEISRINRREISVKDCSSEMQEVLRLSEETRQQTYGYFSIVKPDGSIDPSGLVKGWTIYNAARRLLAAGFRDFYVEAGGDVQTQGANSQGKPWGVGIKNPFKETEIIKVVYSKNNGIATSGTYIRGQHIYNPLQPHKKIEDIVSLTVIGPNVYEADRFATAAFAMGKDGISLIERESGLEGYIIDKNGIATMTSGFEKYTYQ